MRIYIEMKRKLHTIVKYAGRLVLPAICTAALGLSAYADIISDVPYLDAASMESSAPAAVTPPPASAAASGNGTVLPTETSPAISADDSVIVDTPDATGGTASNVAAPAQSGTAAQAVSGPVPGETSPAAQTGQESTASAARTEQESASLTAQADTAAGPGPGVGAAGASGQIQTGDPGIAASADTAASAGSGVPGADHASSSPTGAGRPLATICISAVRIISSFARTETGIS